jgi:hypothetical protein
MQHGTRTITSRHVAPDQGFDSKHHPQAKRNRRSAQKPNSSSSAGTNARVQCARSNKPRRARPASSRGHWRLLNRRPRPGPRPPRVSGAAAMENLISLVNKLQRACTALGDHGEESALPTLWDSLPAIAVVGGQV